MKYKIVFFDPKRNIQSETFEVFETKKKAEQEVRKLRKWGLPAFYKKIMK